MAKHFTLLAAFGLHSTLKVKSKFISVIATPIGCDKLGHRNMKTIKKGELFRNLSGFLTAKGIELKDGVYVNRINHACSLLTDAINGTQKTVSQAKVEVDKKLGQLRQTIHEA